MGGGPARAFPVHKPGTIVMPDVEWRETVKGAEADYAKIDWEPFIAQAEAIDRKEHFVTAMELPAFSSCAITSAEITNILMAFYESPEDLKDLIKYITEWKLTIAEGVCKYIKPDVLFHHDDWGTDVSTFVSPEMFEEFFLPSYKEALRLLPRPRRRPGRAPLRLLRRHARALHDRHGRQHLAGASCESTTSPPSSRSTATRSRSWAASTAPSSTCPTGPRAHPLRG